MEGPRVSSRRSTNAAVSLLLLLLVQKLDETNAAVTVTDVDGDTLIQLVNKAVQNVVSRLQSKSHRPYFKTI